jgi:hypothetical protein
MATLSNLVTVLAHVTGVPDATVFAYGRFAREAGLISQAGRGLGGAQMTPTDAANLLIAIGGTRITKEAGKAIAALRPLEGRVWHHRYQEPQLPLKQWIGRYHSFSIERTGDEQLRVGTFLDFLLTEASTGKFEDFVRSLQIWDSPRLPDPRYYEAQKIFQKDRKLLPFKKPASVDIFNDVEISLAFSPSIEQVIFGIDYNVLFTHDTLTISFGDRSYVLSSNDLSTESSVSQRTIFALGDCLRPKTRQERSR